MNIVHVIGTLDPDLGGLPAVAACLAAAQAGQQHDVAVLYHSDGAIEARIEKAMGRLPHFAHVKRITLPASAGGMSGRGLGRHVEKAIANTDIIHMHGVWEPLLRITGRCAQKAAVPYVLCPHGMLDPWCLSQKRLKKRLALMMGYRAMLNGVAFLHTLNRDEARLIEPLRLTPPTRVIPNGVFLEEIEPLPQRGGFYESQPQLAGRPFVLFLSRLHYKKGLDYLADAFAQVAERVEDLQLVVAGPDDGAQQPFEQQVKAAGLEDRVHVTGPIYGPAKYAAMVDAQCFCLPSRQEGFSVAVTEAMACGLPVVITHACHFPEVAEVAAGSIVDEDPTPIADALVHICQDQTARTEMSAAGRKLVAERFTWNSIARQAVEFYQQFVTVR